MPKINQEEYEVLKELDDKWKYLARNNMYGAKLEVHTSRPYKMTDSHWSNGDMTLELLGGEHLFQFIQWEDEEPHNIAELIKEYEYSTKHVSHVVNERVKALGKAWGESKETEVKKNIEWLKETLEERIDTMAKFEDVSYSIGLKEAYQHTLLLINQLDEPEVLSQEWLDENKSSWTKLKIDGYYIPVEKLQNLLVPKQEKEQKYNVRFKVKSSFGTVGIFLYKEGDEVLAGDNFKAYYPKEEECRLTEQEIRGFQNGDILFEHFAVPVEELEE